MPSIAIVTCLNIPEPDVDEELLIRACREAGLNVNLVPWEDGSVEWSQFELVVVRSTWNYYEHESAFRTWIQKVASVTTLWNGSDLMLWNLDKHYLAELHRAGIPTVPTRYITESCGLESILAEENWVDFVIKPTVSAASFMTRKFSRSELRGANEFVCEIRRTHGAMVQKYMAKVESGGEIALIHIDGRLTHGIVKNPRFQGDDESVSESVPPDQEHEEMARRVMATVSEPWLYGRVDLMQSEQGDWVLSELELIEPSLFLTQCPVALDRLVEGIKNRLAV